jgi:hypothetical protein
MRNEITTYSGKCIDLLNPKLSDIEIIDIAIGLSNECRWASQTPFHYSVAYHSLLVAERTETKRYRLLALLHDATEAYLKDIPKPLKNLLPEYQKIEKNFSDIIHAKFGLELHEKDKGYLKKIDLAVQDYEYDNIFVKRNLKLRYASSSILNRYGRALSKAAVEYQATVK